jgi:hypothetical protein
MRRTSKLEKCIASDALRDASSIRFVAYPNCVAFRASEARTSNAFQPALRQTCPKCDAFPLPKAHRWPRVERDLVQLASACSKRVAQRTQIFTSSPPHLKSSISCNVICGVTRAAG